MRPALLVLITATAPWSPLRAQLRPGTPLGATGDAAWSGSPLPFDRGPFGAPGCALGDDPLVVVATAGSDARAIVTLPNAAIDLHTQWAVLDPANPLGLVGSDARRVEIH